LEACIVRTTALIMIRSRMIGSVHLSNGQSTPHSREKSAHEYRNTLSILLLTRFVLPNMHNVLPLRPLIGTGSSGALSPIPFGKGTSPCPSISYFPSSSSSSSPPLSLCIPSSSSLSSFPLIFTTLILACLNVLETDLNVVFRVTFVNLLGPARLCIPSPYVRYGCRFNGKRDDPLGVRCTSSSCSGTSLGGVMLSNETCESRLYENGRGTFLGSSNPRPDPRSTSSCCDIRCV
jgi:hypothetical protein